MNGKSGSSIIAIDGPAASGKSTVAKELARKLGFSFVNSGSLYRAVAWLIHKHKVNPNDNAAVVRLLTSVPFKTGLANKESFILVEEENPEKHLKEEVVNRTVSAISAIPEVRSFLLQHLRSFARSDDIVMEGRDIGSTVFPETPFKFYIDAAPEIRARRRAAQGFKDNLASRDRADSSRRSSPLIIADDADIVDSSSLSISGVVEEVVRRLRLKGLPAIVVQEQ
ncbi:MAG: (d)CMP kinase [Verrucomicrobia bacterium]|nr:(d)CMP kinase [Verrucomicrobiota bacterium]MBV9275125.1 (d)CMP kinase [Verrucomicrobiota bacterium]